MAHPEVPRYSDDLFRTLQPLPGVTGTIKTQPDDFIVDEILGFEPEGSGEHLYLEIQKTGANTGWIAHQLAEFLSLRDIDVSYAGRKDRHSISTQWFSCYLPTGTEADWQTFEAEGVVLKSITWHRSKLRRGQLQGNAFRLRVRHGGLDATAQTDLESRLKRLLQQGFPNYFGPQRFGRDGLNLVEADRLLRKGERIRGNRGILLSAARSWLFNGFLSRSLERSLESSDNPASEQSPEQAMFEEGAQGPLIGKSRDPQPGEEYFNDIEQAWAAGLRKLGAKVGTRDLMVRPGNLTWTFEDEAVVLSFTLPPGSFATALLRELFLVQDAAL